MPVIKFRNLKNEGYMTCPDGNSPDSLIYCQPAGPNSTPLQFEVQGDIFLGATLRVPNTGLFLSYRGTTGAMKLVSDASDAIWQLQAQGDKFGIRNLAYSDYIWAASNGEAYLTRHGDPTNTEAQWFVEGL